MLLRDFSSHGPNVAFFLNLFAWAFHIWHRYMELYIMFSILCIRAVIECPRYVVWWQTYSIWLDRLTSGKWGSLSSSSTYHGNALLSSIIYDSIIRIKIQQLLKSSTAREKIARLANIRRFAMVLPIRQTVFHPLSRSDKTCMYMIKRAGKSTLPPFVLYCQRQRLLVITQSKAFEACTSDSIISEHILVTWPLRSIMYWWHTKVCVSSWGRGGARGSC